MIVVELEVLNVLDQCLKELIGREEVVETVQRDRVLYTRIMCVESDEVGNTHITQFLEHQCTVKRFSLGTAVLTSFIKEWHDHVDTMSLTGSCGDDSFEILIVVVRGHVVLMTTDSISFCVVCDIHHDKKVGTTYRLFDITLALAGTEAYTFTFYKERRKAVSLWYSAGFLLGYKFFTEFYKLLVNLFCKILTSGKCCDTDRSKWGCFFM